MKLLNSGVDTLYWSAYGDVAYVMTELAPFRESARRDHAPVLWREIDGFALSVGPGGGHGYAVYVDCAEFRIYLGETKSRPTFYVQLRAAFIHTAGLRPAIDASVAVVAQLSASPLDRVGLSRVDPFADFGDWSLTQAEADGIVTRVSEITAHFEPRSGLLHSVLVGKKPAALRIYDKRRQLKRKKGGFADLFWGDHPGSVTRVEFEFWSERLHDFGVRSFDDVVPSLGDLWRHGTTKFVELRVPGRGPVESWPVSPQWTVVQSLTDWKFCSSGLVPFRQVQGDRTTYLRALYGYLSSFASIEGLSGERETLRRLLECLPEVSRGRDFAVEAARKVARLPRAYRLRKAS